MQVLNENDFEDFIKTIQLSVIDLENKGEKEKSCKLSSYASFLSSQKYNPGIKTDPFFGIKFYVAPSAKILGGSNYSSHLNQFLYNEDYFEVQKELEILVEQRRKSLTKGTVLTSLSIGVLMPIGGLIAGLVNIPAITGILIQNNSKYSVEYCDSNNFEGYFLSGNGSVAETFGSRHILNPGHSLGFVHTKTQMSGLGASGYITLRICTTYRTLIFVVGWAVNRAKKNRAGLKLYEFEKRVDTNDLCLKAEDLLDIEHAGNDGYHHVNKQAFDKIYLNYSFKNQNIMPVGYKLVISNKEINQRKKALNFFRQK